MTERLRITGGSRRGRRLFSPPKDSIRPASDLIRQAVFNMLAPEIADCAFYDIFSGTGVVGCEALSRGAKTAIFVEADRRQVQLIRKNVDHAGFGREAIVRSGDAFAWSRHFVPPPDPTIVFLGPPYPLFKSDDDRARVWELVETLQKTLRPGDFLVLQFPRFVFPDSLPDYDRWFRLRHYGKSRVGIWRIPHPGDTLTPDPEGSPVEQEDPSTDHGEGATG